jgi:acetyl-CoA acetyltransferase
MREVAVIGVGMHKAGKYPDKGLKELGEVAIWNAIHDSNIDPRDIGCAYFSNALGGAITGQHMVRGQIVLRHAGIGGIPIINVETACASGTLAFREAWICVAAGLYDVALAVGVEKLYTADTSKSIRAMATGSDVDSFGNLGFQYMGMYGGNIRKQMEEKGWTQELFANVAVKGKYNGSLNPYAQYQKRMTVEDVLNSRTVAYPLTLFMCSTMGDGAAAVIFCAAEKARKYSSRPLVTVAAQVTRTSGYIDPRANPEASMADESSSGQGQNNTVYEAYQIAGVGPEDIDAVEIHDAAVPVELDAYSNLGFCKSGEEKEFFEKGRSQITGDHPVNTSGGLAARGHPVGATGLYQIGELVWQLWGEAGPRQVMGRKEQGPRVVLAQNGGGLVEGGAAASCATILKR